MPGYKLRTFEKIRNYEQMLLVLKRALRQEDLTVEKKERLQALVSQYEGLIDFEKSQGYR